MTPAPAPRPSGRGLWVLTVVVVVAVFVIITVRHEILTHNPSPAPRAPAAPSALSRPAPASAAAGPIISPNGEEASHIADELDSPRTDIHADLRIVNDLFDTFRSATHGLNPIGSNAQITAALAGDNQLHYYFIAPNSPAINAQGQLVDRWGSPFFFHQLAGDQMQIRSAGPDRKMYTDDDEVLTPGLRPPHL